MMIYTSSYETSATLFKVSPSKTYSWSLFSDDLFFSLISVALLFDLLFWEGRCLALTKVYVIKVDPLKGHHDLLLIHYHWNTAFPTVAVPLLKQRKVLSLKINFKLTQLSSLKREYIYVNI